MNQLVEPFEASRRRLLSIAYRMLGSLAEAEDVVQDTWLRWHAADPRELATPVAWLTTVATRLAIDRLRRLKREQMVHGAALPEPWLDDTLPSGEEAVERLCELSYGVLLMLQRLSPGERAALLLHEVFDVPHADIARILDIKPDHSRQLVRRAKSRVQTGPARRGADADSARLAQAFVDAIRRHDEDAVVRLVTGLRVVADVADVMNVADDARSTPQAVHGPLPHPAAWSVAGTLARAPATLLARILCAAGATARLQGINGGWGVAVLRYGRVELLLKLDRDGDEEAALYVMAPRKAVMMA